MLQLRAVSLTGYLDLARFVGLDGERMLREAGLVPSAIEDPNNRLPALKVLRLLDRSAELSGCESFGLLMAESRSLASLGPMALLLDRLPNPREAVRACIEFQRMFNDIVVIALDDHDDICMIRLGFVPGVNSVQAHDLFMGIAYRALVFASGGRWQPESIHVVHKEPGDASIWRRVFPVPVEFESSLDGICCSAATMLAPHPHADELMAKHARDLLKLMPVATGLPVLSERTARAISLLLPTAQASVERVAAQLGMSPRSLQRHLDEEGTRFGEVLNRVRRERAAVYLESSDRPITSLAGLLGYDSASSFTRWFTGEFGISPQAWRIQERAEANRPPPTWRR